MKHLYVKHNYFYCVRLFQWATYFDPTCGSSSGLYIYESLKSSACWDPFMLPLHGVTKPIVGVYFTVLYRALASSRTRLLDHTQRRATVGRVPSY